MSMSARLARILTGSVLLSFIGSRAQNLALAEEPTPPRSRSTLSPARGMLLPGVGVAGDADARTSEVNPGQIGLLEEASSAYAVSHWKDGVERAGRGGGLFLAAPTLVPRLISAGSLQWLRPSLSGRGTLYYKLALTPAIRLGRGLAVGASWEHLFGGSAAGLDSFSFGVSARLHPVIALGAVVRDVNRPRFEGAALPREWDGELVLRPWSDDRFELTAGARYTRDAGTSRVQPRLRLSGRVASGTYLFAEAERPRFELVQTAADGTPTGGRAIDYQVALGLSVGFGHAGVTLAALRSVRDADDDWVGEHRPFALGGHLALLTSFNRHAALATKKIIARVRLEGLGDDRQFVQTALRLRRLAADESVGAVLLVIEDTDLGLGRTEELRALVKALRARGKATIAHLSNPDTRDYYLASACDRIVLHPAGGLTLTGLSTTVLFYKSLMEKVGVNLDLVRIADWKSAMEPFVFERSSDPARQNRAALLDDVSGRLFLAIAEERRLRPEAARALVDRAIFGAADARDKGLVDALADDQQIEEVAQAALGRKWPVRDADAGPVMAERWLPTRVAVLLVDGAIAEGKGGGLPFQSDVVAWSERLIASIKQLRSDPSVRAVVLRVNSPGGSAFASDEIAREVVRLRQAGKIVITSMGDVAASGGYYVAAPTELIFANASTVTGSIGIYSYKVDARALAEKLGIGIEVTTRGAHADFHSPYRPWTEEEKGLARRRIELLYGQFIDIVAAGRKHRGLTSAYIDARLARGRVFTGAQARQVGLVDEEGGVVDAIAAAARRAGVPSGPDGLPEVIVLPPPVSDPLEALLAMRRLVTGADLDEAQTSGSAATSPNARLLALPLFRESRGAQRLLAPLLLGKNVGYEARLPYELELR